MVALHWKALEHFSPAGAHRLVEEQHRRDAEAFQLCPGGGKERGKAPLPPQVGADEGGYLRLPRIRLEQRQNGRQRLPLIAQEKAVHLPKVVELPRKEHAVSKGLRPAAGLLQGPDLLLLPRRQGVGLDPIS